MASNPGFLERGLALHRGGDLAGAAREYQALLARDPGHADALHLLGLIAYKSGRLVEARDLIGRALARDAANPVFLANLGNVEKDAGDAAAAAASYRRALAADPHMGPARNNLGTLLLGEGRLDEAIACFRGVIETTPDHARAWFNLASALAQRGDLAAAVDAHRRSLALDPDHPDGWAELGLALLACGRFDEARVALQRRLDLTLASATAHADLALALHRGGDLAGALAHYERALSLAPDALQVRCNFCALLQKTCDWDRLERHWPPIAAAIEAGEAGVPAGLLAAQPGVTPAMQLAAARADAALWPVGYARPAQRTESRSTAPRSRRVRVGYLSADYRAHATAYLTAGLFEAHDRSRCEVLLFSYGPDDGSAMRSRVIAAADAFVELAGMTDDAAAARIAGCDLDVLVDLNGNTDNGRVGIAARRPAPIQVSWLGFPGTLGAPFYDYLVADPRVIPPGHERWYAEQVVRLPDVYQSNDRYRARPAGTLAREALGLPPQGVVLCCFNQSFKITRESFSVWLDVLETAPAAVLWLLEDNASATAALREALHARGMAQDRLLFAPHRPLDEHLARYRAADLAIDTFPYSSHTTASDALWMGCPLATRAGDTFASRVAASLVTAAGLPELVADSAHTYRALLMRLVQDASLREGLRAKAARAADSVLFDTDRFARNLESAFEGMVAHARAGAAPQAFDVRG